MNDDPLARWVDADPTNDSALSTALRAHKRLLSPEARCHLTASDLVPPRVSAASAALPMRRYVVGPTVADRVLAALRVWGGRRG